MSASKISSVKIPLNYAKIKIFNLLDDEFLAQCDGSKNVVLYSLPLLEKTILTFRENVHDIVYTDEFLGVYYRYDTIYYLDTRGNIVNTIYMNRDIINLAVSPDGDYIVIRTHSGFYARSLVHNKNLNFILPGVEFSVTNQGIIHVQQNMGNYSVNFSLCAINTDFYPIINHLLFSDFDPERYNFNLREFEPVHFDLDSRFFLIGTEIIKVFKGYEDQAVPCKLLERRIKNFLLSKNFFIGFSFFDDVDVYLKSEITADVDVNEYTYVKYLTRLSKKHITGKILHRPLPGYPNKFEEDESLKMMLLYFPLNVMEQKIILLDVDVSDETLSLLNPAAIIRTGPLRHAAYSGDKIIILNPNCENMIPIYDYIRQNLGEQPLASINVRIKTGKITTTP